MRHYSASRLFDTNKQSLRDVHECSILYALCNHGDCPRDIIMNGDSTCLSSVKSLFFLSFVHERRNSYTPVYGNPIATPESSRNDQLRQCSGQRESTNTLRNPRQCVVVVRWGVNVAQPRTYLCGAQSPSAGPLRRGSASTVQPRGFGARLHVQSLASLATPCLPQPRTLYQ